MLEGIQKIKETCDSDHENVKDMLKVLMRENPVPKLVSASKEVVMMNTKLDLV